MTDDNDEEPQLVRSPKSGVEGAREAEERRRVAEIAREIEELGRALDDRDRLTKISTANRAECLPSQAKQNAGGIGDRSTAEPEPLPTVADMSSALKEVSPQGEKVATISAVRQQRNPKAKGDHRTRRRKGRSALVAGIIVLVLVSSGALMLMGPSIEIVQDAYRSAIAEMQRLTVRENEKSDAAARKAAGETAVAEEAARTARQKAIAEEAARAAKERAVAEEAARAAKERVVAEEAARAAKEKAVAEEAARAAKERAVAEEAARAAKEKAVAEEAARAAREKAVAEEAERKAAEEKLAAAARRREEAARLATDEKAKAEAARDMIHPQTRAAAQEPTKRQTAEDRKAEEPPRKVAEGKPKSDAEVREQANRVESDLNLSEQDRKRVQVFLTALGHEVPATGHFGPRTRAMIAAWQKKQGMPETGFLDESQLVALREQTTLANRAEETKLHARQQAEKAESGLNLSELDRKRVQVSLTALGHETPATGHFGPRTRAMIVAWQKKQGLPETGLLDESQLVVLHEQATLVTRAEEVESGLKLSEQDRKRVQVALNALGHKIPTPTGYFGPLTRAMIMAWQQTQALPQTGYLTEAQLGALQHQAAAALGKYDRAQAEGQRNPRGPE
ncbi:MAG TPA: peptidoglycan-binding protein [Vineibacter sp.]|nr:peptidoglycan-binding protein [Vineibacter sp.]